MQEIGSVYKLKAIYGSNETWETPKKYLKADCGDYELSNVTMA